MIKLTNITKVYHMGNENIFALRNIDLTINDKEFAIITGPSGSGKTTLFNLIGGTDIPTEGSIVVDDVEITSFGEDALADYRYSKIGFVFQDFNLIENLDVFENIKLGLLAGHKSIRKTSRHWDQRIQDIIDLTGLRALVKHKPDELSGGQRQRIAIARALVKEPSIILADEPTAHLDTDNSKIIVELMRNLNKASGITCLIATHDERLQECAERIIRLKDGIITSC